MNRSRLYHQNIAIKLMSSKFNYLQGEDSPPFKRLILKTLVRTRDPEVGSSVIAFLFNRPTAFAKAKAIRRHGEEYLLAHFILTSQKKKIATDLDLLAQIILPFQIENKIALVKLATHKEFS